MNPPARLAPPPSPSFRPRLRALLPVLLLLVAARSAAGATETRTFAEGRITCEIQSPGGTIPDGVLATLPIAMRAALDHVEAPARPVRLVVRLQAPPPFHRRLLSGFRVEPTALQQGDEIHLQVGSDPLVFAFRFAHELSHWLVARRHPARPPLWLDEGLAQMVGAAAAEARARTLKQDLARPAPARLDRHLFSLPELTALRAYPASAARSAAFYWQAEKLARAIRDRLGAREFAVYLGLLSAPGAPDWTAPLRERWYFSDWDMDWLARQIVPAPPPAKTP